MDLSGPEPPRFVFYRPALRDTPSGCLKLPIWANSPGPMAISLGMSPEMSPWLTAATSKVNPTFQGGSI